MYEHDADDLAVLGWEEFVLRQWESIFLGYRSNAGLRAVGRRWSDLIEAGIGCSQEIASSLVRTELIDRPDRDLEGAVGQTALLTQMTQVLTGLADALRNLRPVSPDQLDGLLERHAHLVETLA